MEAIRKIALFFALFALASASSAATPNIDIANIVAFDAYPKAIQLKGEFQSLENAKKNLRTAGGKFSNLFKFGHNSAPGYVGPDKWYPIEITEADTLYHHNMMAMLGACSLYYRAASTFDPRLPKWEDTIETKLKYLQNRKTDARNWAGSMFGGKLPNMGYAGYVAMFQQSDCCPAGTYNYVNYGFDVGYCQVCEPGWFCLGGSNRFECPLGSEGNINPGAMPAGAYSRTQCGSELCPAGGYWYYETDKANGYCKLCEADHFCPGGLQPDDDKIACPAGTNSLVGSWQADNCKYVCMPGEYWNAAKAGGNKCDICPADGWCAGGAEESAEMTRCPANHSTNGEVGRWNASQCEITACPCGEYWDHGGGYCSACPADRICSGGAFDDALAQPQACPAGYRISAAAACPKTCEPIDCECGTYWDGAACSSCPSGSVCKGGSDAPVLELPCGAGFELDACSGCRMKTCECGTYWDGAGCAACPASGFSCGSNDPYHIIFGQPFDAAAAPVACGAGFVSGAGVCGMECAACPADTYWSAGACLSCPANYQVNAAGDGCEFISKCHKDFHSFIGEGGTEVCTTIPANGQCSGVNLECATGYDMFYVAPTSEYIFGRLGCRLPEGAPGRAMCGGDKQVYRTESGGCVDIFVHPDFAGAHRSSGTPTGTYYFIEAGRYWQNASSLGKCSGGGYSQPCFGFAGASCARCAKGTFTPNDAQGQSACVACPDGRTTGGEGASHMGECNVCCSGGRNPDGTCAGTSSGCSLNLSDGQNCGAGMYGKFMWFESTQIFQCIPCEPGTFQNSTEMYENCRLCGTDAVQSGQGAWYQDEAGKNSCKPCPHGAICEALGATSFECDADRDFSLNAAGDGCELPPCPAGEYRDADDICVPEPEVCPAGFIGTPPNCEPEPVVPPTCPAGFVGTPPNCEPEPAPAATDCNGAGFVLSNIGINSCAGTGIVNFGTYDASQGCNCLNGTTLYQNPANPSDVKCCGNWESGCFGDWSACGAGGQYFKIN